MKKKIIIYVVSGLCLALSIYFIAAGTMLHIQRNSEVTPSDEQAPLVQFSELTSRFPSEQEQAEILLSLGLDAERYQELGLDNFIAFYLEETPEQLVFIEIHFFKQDKYWTTVRIYANEQEVNIFFASYRMASYRRKVMGELVFGVYDADRSMHDTMIRYKDSQSGYTYYFETIMPFEHESTQEFLTLFFE